MSNRSTHRRLVAVVIAALAAAIAFVGVASSASAATIYACQKKKTGAIVVVTKKKKCNKKTEKKVSWNTEGKAGKNGTNGKDGPAGKDGAAGKDGTNGKDGEPRYAIPFNIDRARSSSTVDTLATVDGAEIAYRCSTPLFGTTSARITVTGGTGNLQSGAVWTNNGDLITTGQEFTQYETLSAAAHVFARVTPSGGPPTLNKGHVSGSIRTTNAVVFIDAYMAVDENPSGPSDCILRGALRIVPRQQFIIIFPIITL